MNIYLICNNSLSSSIAFDESMDIEQKKELRPLSSEGSILASKINLPGLGSIYSSTYLSSIETTKVISEKTLINVKLDKNLNDLVIGNLKNQSLKMLSYFQEHDFNYKLPGGESLNECACRIEKIIKKIKSEGIDAAVFLPRRALFSYLAKITDHGFNLEERLVLTKNDEIIYEPLDEGVEIIKICISDDEEIIQKIGMEV